MNITDVKRSAFANAADESGLFARVVPIREPRVPDR
jgi:hypothetical protein